MDVFKALRMAIRAEIAAQKMYSRFAEETTGAEAKSLFKYLAEYEVMHQQFLEAERRALVAAQGDERGKPSHWLKLLREELGTDDTVTGTADRDLVQYRLSLSAAESVAKILKDANEELSQRQARYERELAIAADIQRKLLPQDLPQNTDLQIAASNTMARSVGGDYYDFITNQQGQLALVVADSMGKGMPAALLMTTVRAIWRSQGVATDSRSPGQTLEMINRAVYPDMEATEAFVTMFNALYDPTASVFQCSSAGHNPPIFLPASSSECKELDTGGTPIGMFPNAEFPSSEFAVSEGDIIVIYTDGVVEAVDRNDTPFGFDRLCSLVSQNHDPNAEDVKNAILSELNSHTGGSPQADDTTIVVLKKI
jgi:serine phosphatase RsbU (regulator of sigma subunit)